MKKVIIWDDCAKPIADCMIKAVAQSFMEGHEETISTSNALLIEACRLYKVKDAEKYDVCIVFEDNTYTLNEYAVGFWDYASFHDVGLRLSTEILIEAIKKRKRKSK